MWMNGNSTHRWYLSGQSLWKKTHSFVKNNIMLLCDSSIPLTFLMKNVHSFIFHFKKKVKQSKCLSTREWESRLWSIHSGVSYSKESNELGLRAAMWT